MDLLTNYGPAFLVGVVLIFAGLRVPGFRGFLMSAVGKLFGPAVLKQLFLEIAEKLVKSTKTKVDDKWLEDVKKDL